MEYPGKVVPTVVLFLFCNTRIRASILYPTDGHLLVANKLINPKDTFIAVKEGKTMFGTMYFQSYVDKKGGLYTTIPTTPEIYIDLWRGSELYFVEHPTGKLLLGLVSDDKDGLLTRATDEVRTAFGDTSFQAKELFVMTYANYTADGTDSPPMNTFQLVIMGDADITYVQFNYPPEEMGWWKDSSGRYPTMEIKYNGTSVMTIPRSGTAEIEHVILKGNTPNVPGRWMFRVDGICSTCITGKGGYMLSCVDGNTTQCICSSCDAESLDDGGLTQEQINIIISVCVIGGLVLIAAATGGAFYYKKHHEKG